MEATVFRPCAFLIVCCVMNFCIEVYVYASVTQTSDY